MSDPVNHPTHYTQGPIEVIEIIEGFDLNFHLGNVIKYVLRASHKGKRLQDLKKARWYLDRFIGYLNKEIDKEEKARLQRNKKARERRATQRKRK